MLSIFRELIYKRSFRLKNFHFDSFYLDNFEVSLLSKIFIHQIPESLWFHLITIMNLSMSPRISS